ncbi:MAG: sulfide/dihydroorotate dehydrogenase-like FAD/NAD-binding protein [Bacillota bacterium]|nr:sulfide/dihydroorotate dehydrogenase-like FAD/NAD-binding protein [Bacillota bacterium]
MPCPCHLAETGDCILCSQLSGKNFCDCVNWKGVCIYQEYFWNGCKAKDTRTSYLCRIISKENVEENVIILTLLAKHKLVQDLNCPGGFIFMRNPKSDQFFDAPISIMEADIEENTLTLAIELKGVKTKNIDKLQEDDNVLIRGPYWNGVLGLKNVTSTKDSTAILVARGIGQAPMIPVMKKLYSQGNKIIAIIDKGSYKNLFINDYLEMCNAITHEINMLNGGDLSEEFIKFLTGLTDSEKPEIIHCAGPDILISKVMNFVKPGIKFSCCNNAKMCCGEGVCGTCSVRYKGHKVKKLCKVQIDPEYIFKDRRFL